MTVSMDSRKLARKLKRAVVIRTMLATGQAPGRANESVDDSNHLYQMFEKTIVAANAE